MSNVARTADLTDDAKVPSISVVICAYSDDRYKSLLRAVQSVREQTAPPRETIVVVDHNPRLLERATRELAGAVGVRVVDNTEPAGLSGREIPVSLRPAETRSPLLDDEAVAELEWLERLGEHYADPRVLGVGGAIEPLWLVGPAEVLSARVQLGCRLYVPRASRYHRGGAESHRREHLVPSQRLR